MTFMAENKTTKTKVSTEPYKGVRDFYPADMAILNYIFSVWRKTAESFGYQEYNASVLELADLYRAKSGTEIVSEQMYVFKDKGDREVALRPEMTPTVARMIAAKRKELAFPIRWYSIPNAFRYERPQKGRTREFFQFNADVFGIDGIEADIEIINLAYTMMKNFGFKDDQFRIGINVSKGVDNKKIDEAISKLSDLGIKNAGFDSEIVRGMDYYTGVVFEVYDTSKENPRAIFGGGRYDNLLDIFGTEKISAVGIGMGDVIARDMLETYGLIPDLKSAADLYICTMDEKSINYAENLAQKSRASGIRTIVDYSNKKIGDQIKYASKNNIPFIAVIGENEVKTGKLKIKELSSGKETDVTEDSLSKAINASRTK